MIKHFLGLTALAAGLVASAPAQAQSDPFLGQVSAFGNNFCPRSWLPASGQLLSIAQNTALFSLLGTNYGGDGRSTFGLPNLNGALAVSPGRHPGSSYDWRIGQRGGAPTVTLTVANLANHRHSFNASANSPDTHSPQNAALATYPPVFRAYAGSGNLTQAMDAQMVGNSGGNQPVDIRQPYTVMTFCIATQGIYPSRS